MQCMKRKATDMSELAIAQLNSAKPKTIQELQSIRDPFIASKINRNNDQITNADLILFQEYWVPKNFPTHPLLMGQTAFSPITLLTMALKSPKNPIPVLFHEKKEMIQKYLKDGFIPTEIDKEYAFLEKWERCQPIIKNICLINCAYEKNDFLSFMPRELINMILLRMFKTEESLL